MREGGRKVRVRKEIIEARCKMGGGAIANTENGEKGHEPRNAGSIEELAMNSSLELPGGRCLANNLILPPRRPAANFWPSEFVLL